MPKALDPETVAVRLSVSRTEYEILLAAARKLGTLVPHLMRDAAMTHARWVTEPVGPRRRLPRRPPEAFGQDETA